MVKANLQAPSTLEVTAQAGLQNPTPGELETHQPLTVADSSSLPQRRLNGGSDLQSIVDQRMAAKRLNSLSEGQPVAEADSPPAPAEAAIISAAHPSAPRAIMLDALAGDKTAGCKDASTGAANPR